MSWVQKCLHDVFFINIVVSSSNLANSTQAASMLESSEVFLAERNTCESLTEFRWLEKETWKGPLIINQLNC